MPQIGGKKQLNRRLSGHLLAEGRTSWEKQVRTWKKKQQEYQVAQSLATCFRLTRASMSGLCFYFDRQTKVMTPLA
jgi:hypothetical protein